MRPGGSRRTVRFARGVALSTLTSCVIAATGCGGSTFQDPNACRKPPVPIDPTMLAAMSHASATTAIGPLRTSGASLLDPTGKVVRLESVNWYGAESADYVPGGLQAQPVDTIAKEIKDAGFNSVRLPFSNYMLECDPQVSEAVVMMNQRYVGKGALFVYDDVVRALVEQGLLVILDNHTSDAEWAPGPENGLWENARYREQQWISDWGAMAGRFKGVNAVVGADLRNEPGSYGASVTWGQWRVAAQRAGTEVLAANPDLLVIVEGVGGGGDLSSAQAEPVVLTVGGQTVSNKLVYSAHDYASSHNSQSQPDPPSIMRALDARWGDILGSTPLWVGEFGTCDTSTACLRTDGSAPGGNCLSSNRYEGTWFAAFVEYLRQHPGVSWAYWPLNGTQSSPGPTGGRAFGAEECYGLLEKDWTTPPGSDAPRKMLLCTLQSLPSPSASTSTADGCTPIPPVPVAGGAAPTVLKIFEPWVPVGQVGGFAPASGLVVTHGGNATCDSGSNDDPGRLSAVRCFASGNVITPCFVYTRGGDPANQLLCSNDPTSNQVTEVTPTGEGVPVALLNHEDPSQPAWFLVLADGHRCSLQGYGTNTNVLSYDCGGAIEATMPNRSKPTWTVREGTNQMNPKLSQTSVPVVTAYR